MGAESYTTYQVLQPKTSHFRPATCAEVSCARARNGWRSVMDTSTVDGAKQANWVRMKSGRAFTYTQVGAVVTFTFAPGQRCFEKHQVWLQRRPLLRVAGGDWRGNPRGTPTLVMKPADWIDHFGEHQNTLADAHRKG
jgi:hypothetical protein